MKELSNRQRCEVFNQAGLTKKRNKTHNIHHIIFKSDIKRGLVDKHFPICARSNLIPLPIIVHRELHELVENTPAYRNNIECRIWIANYAYNGELDML